MIFFDTMRRGSGWRCHLPADPGVALLAGVVVGLFQALTSIQELTLTFVPKLAAIVLVFWLSMGFMTQTLVDLLSRTGWYR